VLVWWDFHWWPAASQLRRRAVEARRRELNLELQRSVSSAVGLKMELARRRTRLWLRLRQIGIGGGRPWAAARSEASEVASSQRKGKRKQALVRNEAYQLTKVFGELAKQRRRRAGRSTVGGEFGGGAARLGAMGRAEHLGAHGGFI
jgi:hypothetical protein